MTVHKLTAGDGYTYLTRQVAAHDATNRGYDNLGEYYSEKGEAPGVWRGRGLAAVPDFPVGEQVTEAQMMALFGQGRHPNADAIERATIAEGYDSRDVDMASRLGAPYRIYEQSNMFHRRSAGAFRDYNTALGLHADTAVPAEERARMRTELARKMFVEEFDRAPTDARELSGHLARISRQATTAVAGYDLSFSPVKSISTLWEIAPREVAAEIERAHHDAVKDTLTWLEDNAAFTRTGRNGVAQVEVQGLIAAAFTHRDSRAGDPDLHTHVAISNKVQTLAGRWLALDGRPLYKNNVAASERYNTRIEALLIERVGLRFGDRPGSDPGKRPVREIIGIDGALPRVWSSRRAAIDTRRAALSAQFQVDHGRPPTPKEAVALAERANKETRQRKHEPRSHAEQRETWRAEAIAVLGGDAQLHYYIRGAMRDRTRRQGARPVSAAWVAQTADTVLSIVASSRATWQGNHIRAEAERQARAAGVRHGDLDRAVDAVVAAALGPSRSVPLDTRETLHEPAALRRSDGTSVYTVAGSALYTSADIIAAEQSIVAAAGDVGGRTIPATLIDITMLESAANGVQLNPGQVQLVRELATSGAHVQLALAPAGTGKTTAMRVLSRAWTADGGHVVGLAPSAAAAAVLREEIGADTDTLAKLTWHLTNGGGPDWIAAIGADTLVVIDEAGMAGTPDLAAAIDYVTSRGGSVRLIGDDQQLAAIGAGGVLRDIAATRGAVTLSQVMRFTDPTTGAPNHAEGAASLALRDGDTSAIAYYLDSGRVHVGDLTTATNDAYGAWFADRTRGLDAVMLAPTRDLVAELNDRARADRLAAQEQPVGREVGLASHASHASHASTGDTIITRQNNRKIPITASDWVKNGDRWTITAVRESGALDVTHLRTGRHITLPADYVKDHVTLGYAATVHGAQGITADSCHIVATGEESRQLMYVALTRGRHANHIYLTTAGDGDPHSVITRDALLPPTAGDILARVLARDASPVSATSQARAFSDPAGQLQAAAGRYHHALATAAEDRLGVDALTGIDEAAETAIPGLTRHEAYPTLRAHLALLAVDGHKPAEVLTQASSSRGLADARDVAAVLDWRLDPTGHRSGGAGPLPWLPPIPDALAADREWGDYLRGRCEKVTALSGAVAARARTWTPTSAPLWANGLIDRDPELVADLAVWRAANSVDDGDRRSTGPPLPAAADARAQRALDRRVTHVLGDPKAATARWAPLAHGIDPRVAADPYWATLADRLTAADRAGIDIASLARAVGADAPLPDEQPAAALWWRLSRHLSPAAMTATDHSVSDTLRPDWTAALHHLVGEISAARILADPAWPALVAAVTHAGRAGWQPHDVLGTAHELLLSGQPEDEPLRPDELATALAWRICMLTDTAPAIPHSDSPPPPQDEDNDSNIPADIGQLPDSGLGLDGDWLPVAGHDEPDDDPEPSDRSATRPEYGYAPDPIAEDIAALQTAEEERYFARMEEEHFWATAAVSRERLLELNAAAEAFFTDRYRTAWAANYMAERLGTDLAGDDRFAVGYAPASWTGLTNHLRRAGATDEEIIAAGLGSRASTGRVIDRFRDRLMFPIKSSGSDGEEVHGFIGRRNPTKTDDDNAGPKYLNTAATDLFTKGHELYGLTESTAALNGGAALVIVEGPMDTIAVTLAGDGDYVGVAPLGTALTDTQADKLRPYIGPDRPPTIVATDADRGGQLAAHRAFWQLAARGDDPTQLLLPDGSDPADLLRTDGPAALHARLATAGSLADQVIAARIAPLAARLDTIEGRIEALRRAADVVGALPPTSWPQRSTDLATNYGVALPTAIEEVLEAGEAWIQDPRGRARRRLTERIPDLPAPSTPPHPDPTQRWAALAESITVNLPADEHWPVLAQHLTRAANTGYDVDTRLPLLVAQRPLPGQHPARDLDLRLISDCPGCLPPLDPASQHSEQARALTAAETRMAVADRHTANRPRGPGHAQAAPEPRRDQAVATPASPAQHPPPQPRHRGPGRP